MHRYQPQIDQNLLKAKKSLPDWDLCKAHIQIAIEYLDLQQAHDRFDAISRPKLAEMDAEIVAIFERPWLKRQAE